MPVGKREKSRHTLEHEYVVKRGRAWALSEYIYMRFVGAIHHYRQCYRYKKNNSLTRMACRRVVGDDKMEKKKIIGVRRFSISIVAFGTIGWEG